MTQIQPLTSLSLIIPAYNEAQIIGQVVQRLQAQLAELPIERVEILVIDDGSTDETAVHASQAGATVISHPYNIGNGAAIKTGIRHATGDYVLMMDADGQHPPAEIPRLLAHIGPYDMVVGARTAASDSAKHRDLANFAYNQLASYVSGYKIEDLTSGFRVIKRKMAREFVYLLPNTFSYPTTLTLAILRSGYSLKYVPFVAPKRVGKSKIKLFRDGSRFLMIIMKVAIFFAPLKIFLPTSFTFFMLGLGWYLFRVFVQQRPFPPISSLMMITAVLIFMIGLVSEQIAQLRFDRAEP